MMGRVTLQLPEWQLFGNKPAREFDFSDLHDAGLVWYLKKGVITTDPVYGYKYLSPLGWDTFKGELEQIILSLSDEKMKNFICNRAELWAAYEKHALDFFNAVRVKSAQQLARMEKKLNKFKSLVKSTCTN